MAGSCGRVQRIQVGLAVEKKRFCSEALRDGGQKDGCSNPNIGVSQTRGFTLDRRLPRYHIASNIFFGIAIVPRARLPLDLDLIRRVLL